MLERFERLLLVLLAGAVVAFAVAAFVVVTLLLEYFGNDTR